MGNVGTRDTFGEVTRILCEKLGPDAKVDAVLGALSCATVAGRRRGCAVGTGYDASTQSGSMLDATECFVTALYTWKKQQFLLSLEQTALTSTADHDALRARMSRISLVVNGTIRPIAGGRIFIDDDGAGAGATEARLRASTVAAPWVVPYMHPGASTLSSLTRTRDRYTNMEHGRVAYFYDSCVYDSLFAPLRGPGIYTQRCKLLTITRSAGSARCKDMSVQCLRQRKELFAEMSVVLDAVKDTFVRMPAASLLKGAGYWPEAFEDKIEKCELTVIEWLGDAFNLAIESAKLDRVLSCICPAPLPNSDPWCLKFPKLAAPEAHWTRCPHCVEMDRARAELLVGKTVHNKFGKQLFDGKVVEYVGFQDTIQLHHYDKKQKKDTLVTTQLSAPRNVYKLRWSCNSEEIVTLSDVLRYIMT